MVDRSYSKHLSVMGSHHIFESLHSSSDIKSVLTSDSFSFFPENFEKVNDKKVDLGEVDYMVDTMKDKLRIDGEGKH
jgi:hypothetical protein